MSTAPREAIGAELAAALGDGYQVEPYSRQVDGVQRPLLMLQVPLIAPRRDVGPFVRDYRLALLAVAPVADVTLATANQVDQLAEDVLAALDQSTTVTWSKCERAVIDDTWAGWQIDATTTLNVQEDTP